VAPAARRSLETLERRQESVAALSTAALARDEVQETLGEAYDLARLASKATHGSADARDLLAVQETLAVLPALADAIASNPDLPTRPSRDRRPPGSRRRAGKLRRPSRKPSPTSRRRR